MAAANTPDDPSQPEPQPPRSISWIQTLRQVIINDSTKKTATIATIVSPPKLKRLDARVDKPKNWVVKIVRGDRTKEWVTCDKCSPVSDDSRPNVREGDEGESELTYEELSCMTVPELRQMCKKRRLRISGTKAELITKVLTSEGPGQGSTGSETGDKCHNTLEHEERSFVKEAAGTMLPTMTVGGSVPICDRFVALGRMRGFPDHFLRSVQGVPFADHPWNSLVKNCPGSASPDVQITPPLSDDRKNNSSKCGSRNNFLKNTEQTEAGVGTNLIAGTNSRAGVNADICRRDGCVGEPQEEGTSPRPAKTSNDECLGYVATSETADTDSVRKEDDIVIAEGRKRNFRGQSNRENGEPLEFRGVGDLRCVDREKIMEDCKTYLSTEENESTVDSKNMTEGLQRPPNTEIVNAKRLNQGRRPYRRIVTPRGRRAARLDGSNDEKSASDTDKEIFEDSENLHWYSHEDNLVSGRSTAAGKEEHGQGWKFMECGVSNSRMQRACDGAQHTLLKDIDRDDSTSHRPSEFLKSCREDMICQNTISSIGSRLRFNSGRKDPGTICSGRESISVGTGRIDCDIESENTDETTIVSRKRYSDAVQESLSSTDVRGEDETTQTTPLMKVRKIHTETTGAADVTQESSANETRKQEKRSEGDERNAADGQKEWRCPVCEVTFQSLTDNGIYEHALSCASSPFGKAKLLKRKQKVAPRSQQTESLQQEDEACLVSSCDAMDNSSKTSETRSRSKQTPTVTAGEEDSEGVLRHNIGEGLPGKDMSLQVDESESDGGKCQKACPKHWPGNKKLGRPPTLVANCDRVTYKENAPAIEHQERSMTALLSHGSSTSSESTLAPLDARSMSPARKKRGRPPKHLLLDPSDQQTLADRFRLDAAAFALHAQGKSAMSFQVRSDTGEKDHGGIKNMLGDYRQSRKESPGQTSKPRQMAQVASKGQDHALRATGKLDRSTHSGITPSSVLSGTCEDANPIEETVHLHLGDESLKVNSENLFSGLKGLGNEEHALILKQENDSNSGGHCKIRVTATQAGYKGATNDKSDCTRRTHIFIFDSPGRLGVQVDNTASGDCVVSHVVQGGEGERVGIRSGDIIKNSTPIAVSENASIEYLEKKLSSKRTEFHRFVSLATSDYRPFRVQIERVEQFDCTAEGNTVSSENVEKRNDSYVVAREKLKTANLPKQVLEANSKSATNSGRVMGQRLTSEICMNTSSCIQQGKAGEEDWSHFETKASTFSAGLTEAKPDSELDSLHTADCRVTQVNQGMDSSNSKPECSSKFHTMKIKELQAECIRRGLSQWGSKFMLIQRLDRLVCPKNTADETKDECDSFGFTRDTEHEDSKRPIDEGKVGSFAGFLHGMSPEDNSFSQRNFDNGTAKLVKDLSPHLSEKAEAHRVPSLPPLTGMKLPASSETRYKEMKIKELQAECKRRSLPCTGAKAVLIARLTKDSPDLKSSKNLPVTSAECVLPKGKELSSNEASDDLKKRPVFVARMDDVALPTVQSQKYLNKEGTYDVFEGQGTAYKSADFPDHVESFDGNVGRDVSTDDKKSLFNESFPNGFPDAEGIEDDAEDAVLLTSSLWQTNERKVQPDHIRRIVSGGNRSAGNIRKENCGDLNSDQTATVKEVKEEMDDVLHWGPDVEDVIGYKTK